MPTRGIHVVWTTYGTWLPGDDRGHWSALFDFYGRLTRQGHRLNPPDAQTKDRAARLMKETPKFLSDSERVAVSACIGGLLAPGMPGAMWPIHAAAIEEDHVHLLFGPLPDDIAKVVGRIKSNTSSALLKLSPNHLRSRTWTEGYWKVFVFDDAVMPIVRRYIVDHNLRRGLGGDPYDWVVPI